ncbi:methylated-DNA--[protein]-cysteine S-methyltransferase [Alicyclobacillus sp. SO9]|nr:methylated-DNA--[protein]-cysteine S-methyltransferase [Alicyclobacillus sp. SO9]
MTFTLVRHKEALCFVGLPNQSHDSIVKWTQSHFPHHDLVHVDGEIGQLAVQLKTYLDGEVDHLDGPLELHGTQFQQAVWDALCAVPFGETRTYSQIAENLRKPSAVRAVGAAIGANPLPIFVPCHRVIGKDGKLTGYRGGIELKASLLLLEARRKKMMSCHMN